MWLADSAYNSYNEHRVLYCEDKSSVKRWLLVVGLILCLVGCAPQETEPLHAQLPTRIPTITPSYNNMYDAEAVVTAFLYHWQQAEWEAMYALLSESSQQATPYDSFAALYQSSHETMRLQSLEFALRAQAREGNRIMIFVYDVTFHTNSIGTFTDQNREIRLVLDGEAWRIAWSPGDIFRQMAEGGLLRLESFPPLRGNIYDRNGEILADMNGRMVKILVIENQIEDLDLCINTLAQVLEIPAEEVQNRLNRNNPDWLAEIGLIEGNVFDVWESALVEICNAQFDAIRTRRYIYGDLLPHVIGTVGYPEADEIPQVEAAGFRQDSILGRSGIERGWDETLRGTPGMRLSIVRPNGEPLRLLGETPIQPSQSVYLTIDLDLQRFVTGVLSEAFVASEGAFGDGGAAVVMNVNTGEILAMVSYPTYNANAFIPFPVMGQEQAQQIIEQVINDPRRPQLNRAAQGRYPSGSIMKTITAIAALASGEYTMDETYFSTGVWNRDIPRVDWLAGGHGRLNLAGALTHSCNTCFYEAGYRLDNRDPYLLPTYANMMGLGVDPGLRDIETSTGFIGTPDTKINWHPEPWSYSDAVNMAIGQGMVEVSPLQMAEAYAIVANNGVRYRPQLVLSTGLLGEMDYHMQPEVLTTLDVSTDILDYIRSGLCAVTTDRSGTAEFVFRNSPLMEDIGVCGKTGTAQNPPNPKPHAWFVGYAPRENPEIVVVVIIENSGDGSAHAAPITRRILEYYFLGED
ncbi:MAG: hypothetical protein CUN56_05860 [Phototrophicales bacterium]|nr:MAG: hypothetical protein CUN56_05860 [Phototrophicales bacterium]